MSEITDAAEPSLLEMRHISKQFPGVRALDDVHFTLRPGEIHALMGENGAGKSTLINVLTGVMKRDAGTMRLAGVEIDPASPAHAQRLGISTVYQEVNLVPELSVAENLLLGRQPRWFGLIRRRLMNRQASEVMRRLDLPIDVTRRLGSYSIAVQQMVAIARALETGAVAGGASERILVFDEPTSSLDAGEVEELFGIMRRLRRRSVGIIFITHFIDQVYAVADRITVLRNGRLVGTYETKRLPRVELVSKMIGGHISAERKAAAIPWSDDVAETILEARRLGRRGTIKSFDLTIGRGEVVGLAGLLGSGRTEAAHLLFGLDRHEHGTLAIRGRRINSRRWSPARSVRNGIGMLPEDRKVDGVIGDLSVRDNIVLALQGRRGWLRRVRRAEGHRIAAEFIAALRISTPHADIPVRLLSGGNQQKVILARLLCLEPSLLILDEPTRGVDVGAKQEIERLIADCRRRGMAMLFISSELEEVLRDSTRVIVMRERRAVLELSAAEATHERIMNAMAGGEP